MKIRVLGAHNCESLDSKFVSLLIDDVVALDAGGLTSSLSFPAQQKLAAILLTHGHYDHIRDIPAIAMNAFLQGMTINIYSIQAVYDALATHLLNNELYPDFLERPEGNATIKFKVTEPLKTVQVGDYNVLPVPLGHSVPAVGYQVTSPDNKILFFTGDTGPGLADCWQQISPQMLIIETTAPNRYEDFAHRAGHLTPSLLKRELDGFRELKGYLPQVVIIHMNPRLEQEIAAEIAAIGRDLDATITIAREGMLIKL